MSPERFAKAPCPEYRRLVDCRREDRFYLRVLEHRRPGRLHFALALLGLGLQCAGAGRLVQG